MLDKAIRLCDATYGHFRTYDGEGFPLAAVCGAPSLVELHRQRIRYFVPGPHNPISRFRRGERLIHISDAAASEAYRGDPGWRALVDTGACRLCARRGAAQGHGPARLHLCLSPGSAAVLRQADRAAAELRRAGGDRDGERAAAGRNSAAPGGTPRSRSRTWATASPCSTKPSTWSRGTASSRRSSTCPTPFSNSSAPMRNTSASSPRAATSARVSTRRSRFVSWSPVPANPTAMSARGRMAG